MKIRFLIALSALAAITAISSCDAIIEKDLRHHTVNILAPANGAALSSTAVTFWWDSLAGATSYSVQIVSPTFSNVLYLIVDSNVVGNKFICSMAPGNYQWRIKALNSGSSSDLATSSFSIDSSLNLANQSVQLISPANGYITNNAFVSFRWASAFSATDYRFEILNSAGSTVTVNGALSGDTASYTFLNDDTYTWRVRAQNGSSVSQYGVGTFMIDKTAPLLPAALSPADGTTMNDPIGLSWTQTTDNGSFIYDSIYIFGDALQDTLVRATRPTIGSYTDSLPTGDYYWKLRAIDSAGNRSVYTSLYKFIIP